MPETRHDYPSPHIETLDKDEAFSQAKQMLESLGFDIIEEDKQRPWGFFLSVNEAQAPKFIETFYKGIELTGIDTELPLRPKILGVEAHKRLSLQTHDRRREIWRCIYGHLHVIHGVDEDHLETELLESGDVFAIEQGEVHRGAGIGDGFAVVAEIWQHIDPDNPSNEDDIIRLQDDFGR